MALFHLLGQDDQMRYNDFFGHVMPLALALCDADSIVNGTTEFLRSKDEKVQHNFCVM